MILHQAIEKFATETPKKTAILPFNQTPISYLHLRNLIWGNMRQLMKAGVDSQTRIGCISADPLEMALWIYSVSALCIAVPMDHDLSRKQYESLFELFKLDYVILGEGLDPCIISSAMQAGIQVLHVDMNPVDSISHRPRYDHEIALLLTTSGTTSTPKIVPLTHRNFFVAAEERFARYKLTEKDCVLISTRLTRATSIHLLFSANLSGGSAVLMNGFNHLDFFNIYEKHPISWFTAFPAILESIAEYANDKHLSFPESKIRFISSIGSPLPESLKKSLENLFSTRIIRNYGMTETATIASTFGVDTAGKDNSVGIFLGNSIKIHEGEILVKGENVFQGYLDNPEANREAFIDGWFRTGDLGRIDEDGFIYIDGRIKEMINRGGEKVSPYEVEACLEKHPLVKQAVVFPKIDNQKNEEVAAAVVLEDHSEIDMPALRNFLGAYISAYKIPTVCYAADHIPLGENGKFQRNKLSAHFSGFKPLADSTVERAEKLTATEEVVKKYYEKTLKKEPMGIRQNFFDAGGDSLLASVLHSELMDAFETDIPVHALFDYPEIGKLAAFIDSMERRKGNLKFVVPLRKSGFKKPLFFIHSLDGDALGYYSIATLLDPERPMYGIQFKYDDCWTAPLDFSQIASKYIEEIKLVQAGGPYHLAGICLGGQIAYEIARQLTDKHEEVGFLAMFDVILVSEKDAAGIPKNTIMKKSVRTLKQLKETPLKDYGKLLSRKANSLYLYLSTKYIVKINSKRDFLLKNLRALLTQAASISRHESYSGPVVYYQAKDPSRVSELSANTWKKLIPNIKVIRVDMEHNDLSDPLMAPRMAALLDKELRNIASEPTTKA